MVEPRIEVLLHWTVKNGSWGVLVSFARLMNVNIFLYFSSQVCMGGLVKVNILAFAGLREP